MIKLISILVLSLCVLISNAQSDTLLSISQIIIAKSKSLGLKISYNDSSQVYDYSGNWDFDGDTKTDNLYFVGNGGAHTLYYLKIILSSEKKIRDFSFISIDFPIPGKIEDLRNKTFYPFPSLFSFVVFDFDEDGIDEVFIYLTSNSYHIPRKWRRKGLNSRYILLDVKSKELILKNFVN